MNIHPLLVETLVCPACRSALEPREADRELLCTGCGLAYPVSPEGIPVMLVDDARPTR